MGGPPYPHGSTIEIWRAATVQDAYGNDTAGGFAWLETVHGCAVAPRKEAELTENGRTGVIIGLVVYARPTATIRPSDQVRIDGEIYEIDGEPGNWQHPMTGWKPGVELNLRRVEG